MDMHKTIRDNIRKTARLLCIDRRVDFWLLSCKTHPNMNYMNHIEIRGKNEALKKLRRTFNHH